MGAYEIIFSSGTKVRVSGETGIKIQQCMMGNGPHALWIDSENGRSLFISTAHVESVTVVPVPGEVA